MTSMPLTLSRTLFDMALELNSSKRRSRRFEEGSDEEPVPPAWAGRKGRVLNGKTKSWPRSGSRLTVLRRATRQLLLCRVLVRRRLDHRLDDRLVGLVPVGRELPLAAVPGVHASPGGATVVGAAGRDRAHHAGEAQRVELLLVERQVLVAPARLLGGHPLALAEALLRALDAFDRQHRRHQATHVQHLAHFFLWPGALTLVVHFLQHFLCDLRVRRGAV